MKNKVKILMTGFVARNVKRFIVERPDGYRFKPGQATRISINRPGMEDKAHPFTFTGLEEDLALEFIIKAYPEHKGLTQALHELEPGDKIIIGDAWGTINYKGPGVFIAGGAGISPFIAILRRLHKDGKLTGNRLMFSNKTATDVILEPELRHMFKGMEGDLLLTLTRDDAAGYLHERIDEQFLRKHVKDFSQHFYVCGPPKFVESVNDILKGLGASVDCLVFEK